jgi:TonB family protein
MRRSSLGLALVATLAPCGPSLRAETIDHGTAIVALGWIEGIRAVELEPCPEEPAGEQGVAECGSFLVAEVRASEFLRGRRTERLTVRFPRLPEERELAGSHAALFLEKRGDVLWVAEGRAGLVTSREPFVPSAVDRLRMALALEPARESERSPWEPAPVIPNPAEGVSLPVIVHKVLPEYPALGRQARAQGKVLLSAVIGTDGQVGDLRVLKSAYPGWGLELAAIRAISQWTYEPARKDGQPVAVYMTVAVDFTLQGATPSDPVEDPPLGPLAMGAHAIQDALAELVPAPLDLSPAEPPVLESEERAIRWAYARLTKARREKDLQTIVGLLHPEYLERFRSGILRLASQEGAASFVQQMFGVGDAGALEAMSPSELWMKVGATLGQMGYETGSASRKETYLGVVAEGDDLRHVTQRIRSSSGEMAFEQVSLMTFKRDGPGWKAYPEDGMDRFFSGGEEED